MNLARVRIELNKTASPKKARTLESFFKTGPGQYGEGDRFIGVTAPNLRKIAGACEGLSYRELAELLRSEIHEERALALLVLVAHYQKNHKKKNTAGQEQVYRFYFKHLSRVNNWDLVDGSAGQIVGAHLASKDKAALHKLAVSQNLWERRISIVATLPWVRAGRLDDTLRLAKKLLGDRHDLMHKAVGWCLREVGKKDLFALENFLRKNRGRIPRTALRYAIEKFPEKKRKAYLKRVGKIN